MSSSDQLKQAYALIKAGRKKDALKLIKPILQSDRDNAAAWWLLANAIDDPVRQEKALETVLRLRPGEPKATKMLAQIRPPEPADDPFDVLDSDDDPFSSDSMYAGSGHDDDPFASSGDDPFADDDPFASPAPRRKNKSAAPPARTPRPNGKVNVVKAKSDAGCGMIVMGVGVLFVLCIVGTLVAGVGSMDFEFSTFASSSSSLSSVGNCDIGQTNHSEMTVIECAQVSLDSQGTGRLNGDERHDWTLNGTAGQTISIDVEGDALTDTTLELRDPSGNTIAYDDDGGSGLDSSLTTSLPANGTYVIRVGSYNDEGGDYTVSVYDNGVQLADSGGSSASSSSSSRSATCSTSVDRCASISPNTRVSNYLPSGGHHGYVFSGESGQRVTIDLTGVNDEDMYLELYNEGGRLIAENDDIDLGGGNLNSRLVVTLSGTEDYTILVRTWGSFEDAEYQLNLR